VEFPIGGIARKP